MLVELVVENYAVVERLRVRFHKGLNLLTGETGSGKSIVVDALGLLFGGRASPEMIRSGEERGRLSGIFEVPRSKAFHRILDDAGIEIEDGELLVEREILSGGKSRAFIACRPVTAALLRELAPFLGDIHGQHDQQRLFSPAAQLEMLDEAAGSAALLAEIGEIYRGWRACAQELENLERNEQERLRLADLWSFQKREIEAAALKPGEDAELENERRVLQNFGRLQESASAAFGALYDSPESALTQMRIAGRKIEELCRIDDSLAGLRDALKPAEIAVEDLSHTLRDYLSRLEADPGRLEEIESRLETIDRLKRKYGADIDQVLAFLEDVRIRLAASESVEEQRSNLVRERAKLAGCYQAKAAELTARRQEAARKLEKRAETELASLAMERTVFRVQVHPASWSEQGADQVAFLVSANVGEEPRPIEKVASGGELSRIALALKTCLAAAPKARGNASPPLTLVFDEVDAGIGGSAAIAVGRRLKQLAAGQQVLCVTHLPQIAGFADHHYSVEKREANGRTVASIEELTGEARTREIGRMLAGRELTPEALKHAEQLIRQGQ